ncbi:2-phospho-L-lactate guanylyltransferase [Lentzea sp. DG1S-22]|uniref:2-phospho-L-lactate guanylyltransferase n=1 Tax=Lentzea sp. DG1S-22 TaxID=3108822 RepID=UPI002E75E806|nr:2-phospho-L-lactate guanylyltransferase [Lentzea sp. DG1S-22]WVH80175.1 2-phospho-L-lactate guanylyltransferase [Lentzea sp. DG1S-22]
MRDEVDLVVPVKTLDRAKTRLTSATGGDPVSHAALALALALDTVSAAARTPGVRRVVTITSDPAVASEMAALGVESLPEPGEPGLNAALRHGARTLGSARVGALQADLPALRPDELRAALDAAAGRRAFVPDRQGTGTTLLLAAPGGELDPRFGVGSAGHHRLSGAAELIGPWPSLRCDVDTEEDLRLALALGLGARTANALPAWTT